MAQVKIYGLSERWVEGRRQLLSDVIHGVVMEVLGLPENKRAHRFFPLDREDFFMPAGRSDDYTIVEVIMLTGRKRDTRKKLVRRLFDEFYAQLAIEHQDLEVCILESPAENWGFRGQHGDEIKLDYSVNR